MFRIPGTPWQQPADVVPVGSEKDASGAMRTPFSHDKQRDIWEVSFRVKRRMAPLHLAFDIAMPGKWV